MRYIAVGGMPLDLTLKAETEAAFGLGLSNSYGMSEISPITRSRFAGKGASVGEPQPGISIRIVREDGGDAEPGEAGEIWVKGPNLMLGYCDEVPSQSIRCPDGFITTAISA
jgi:long-subunit acyl-CoA synthetase (AMP-forming)